MRKDYPYNEALDDLTVFVKKHVKDDVTLNRLLNIIEGSREEKTVTIRAIFECYSKYRKDFSDYSLYSKEEDQMWNDLLGIWQ